MVNAEIFEKLQEIICLRIPDFEVRYKDEHLSQKILGILSYPFNRNYITKFASTFYPHVYFPSRQWVRDNYREAWKVLAHEYVHLWDEKNNLLYKPKYLAPQILSVLSIFSLTAIWFGPVCLLALLFLAFLAPLPAPFRKDIELRGYAMSLAVNFWQYKTLKPETIEWIEQYFLGWDYYKMWPYINSIQASMDVILDDIYNDNIFGWKNAEPYKDIYLMLSII